MRSNVVLRFIGMCMYIIVSQCMHAQDQANTINQSGWYKGDIDYLSLNGKEKKPVRGVWQYVQINTDGSFSICLRDFHIGKMPGKVNLFIDHIKPVQSFDIQVKNGLHFIFHLLPNKEYDIRLYGHLINNKIDYILETIGATYLGFPLSVKFHFVGKYIQTNNKDNENKRCT